MKKIHHLSILAFAMLLLSACCDESILLHSYSLTDTQKNAVPYEEGDSISFNYNGEFEFQSEVLSVSNYMETMYHGIESCQYSEYENKWIQLKSQHPELDILLNVSAYDNDYYYDYEMSYNPYVDSIRLSISVNHKGFSIVTPSDVNWAVEQFLFVDTTILGFDFENVLLYEHYSNWLQAEDSTAIYFENLVYSLENGIELITYTNDDYIKFEN